MRNSTAVTRHRFSYGQPADNTEAQTPDTTPQLIALAASLVGEQSKVMEQMRCSEADFVSYCSGEKELPLPELDRLVSLIVEEQRSRILKHRQSLRALRVMSR